MILVRKAAQRGHFDFGWLQTKHTFSFGQYHDPRFMGFRSLRVINEDCVEPGEGFGSHGHQDMEILTYVLEGELSHKDSLGNGSIIQPGDIQRMSAGSGVRHSEFNDSRRERVHFLQIWIMPDQYGTTPSYDQKYFANETKQGQFRLIASCDGRKGSLKIHQDIALYATLLEPLQSLDYSIEKGRYGWIQIARGAITMNGVTLSTGDGASICDETKLQIKAVDVCEFLFFDLS
jgi:redox-sensitive bicupin YhaK (pirin superfamily)